MDRHEIEDNIWFGLMNTSRKMGRAGADLVQAHGITPPQYLVMRQIRAANLTQRELADQLIVTTGNISQIVSIMVRDDLLVREQQGASNRLRLTERAESIMDMIEPAHASLVQTCLAALSPAELTQLGSFLEKIDVTIEQSQE